MGWDYQSALEAAVEAEGAALPVHTRRDQNSLYEVFTLPELVNAFDLSLVNHKRAAVNLSKLDFLNKMTLRRKTGRLGAEGILTEVGKAAAGSVKNEEEGRDSLVKRYQAALKDVPELREWYVGTSNTADGSDLVDDMEYVGKVFDTELVSFNPSKLTAAPSHYPQRYGSNVSILLRAPRVRGCRLRSLPADLAAQPIW